jgi:hypothetical protein
MLPHPCFVELQRTEPNDEIDIAVSVEVWVDRWCMNYGRPESQSSSLIKTVYRFARPI